MKTRPALLRDFRVVRANLSDRMKKEYAAAGYVGDEAFRALKPFLTSGSADAITTDKGDVLAILFYSIEGEVIQTSFMAIDDFFSALSIRIAKKHLRELQKSLGGRELQSNSYPQVAATEAWFKRIGFDVLSTQPGHIVFRLPALSRAG